MSERRRATRLLLLVGSNPLPNYIAAVCLEPQEVVLLYSPQTKQQRDCLRDELRRNRPGLSIRELLIDDATDARMIADACGSVDVDHLHYSGGTKPMAAHALRTLGLKDDQVSYLDERTASLRFDDGYCRSLSEYDLGLTLDQVLRLHGIERLPKRRPEVTSEEAGRIAREVLADPATAHGRPGHWLERWTADQIEAALGPGTAIVEPNVDCRRTYPPETGLRPTKFEIDVVVVRGHRVHCISCTTSKDFDKCKGRLFEVAVRARQMAGDLARSALVCLKHGGNDEGPFVEQLRSHIASVWDAPNPPEVFGLAELREWAGMAGPPDLGTLTKWLDS